MDGIQRGRQERIIAEFQQRRKRLLVNFGLAMVLIAVSLGLLQLGEDFPGFLGLSTRTWKSIGTAQFIAALFFAVSGFRQYRCPVCNEIPRAHDKFYLGAMTDPEKCPHCGTRLRD